MNVTLQREKSTEQSTPVKFYVEGVFECFSLEDIVRTDPNPATPKNEAKVYGETAIPAGKYRVRTTFSPKFQKELPELENVPGFTSIRIHGGRTAKDSLGCLLTGKARISMDELSGGIAASDALKAKIKDAETRGEEVWIDVLTASVQTEGFGIVEE